MDSDAVPGVTRTAHTGSPVWRRAVSTGLGAAACLIAVGQAHAVQTRIEGVRFAADHDVGGVTLRLNCTALLRYMVFIKAYVAALYLGENAKPEEVLSDVPKRLEIEYFHAIKAQDFAAATDDGLAANVDGDTIDRLRPRIDRLNALYEDVRPGDRYSLTYVPGVGTELALNGAPRGTIEGADFAAALFAIWLGPNPLSSSLKSQLLTCS